MKKIFIVMIILMIGVSGVFAQVDIADMQDSFAAFSDDVSTSLPFASTIGLNWSDATVRNFPHFGVGITTGAVMIPSEAFTDLASVMGFDLPTEITDSSMGVPLPGYTLEGRIGGLFLPFDIGVKFGFIPTDVMADLPVAVDYTLVGFDIRTPILKQNLLLPSISLGVGYNYLKSGIGTSLSTGMGESIDISDAFGAAADTNVLSFTDPNARFEMESNVIDVKLQVSKSLLIFTPYVGAGYAYGWSNAGGGVLGSVLYDSDGSGGNDPAALTSTEIAAIEQAFADAGYDAPDLSEDGFLVSSASDGGSLRAYGGISINLFILKLDLNAMYNLNTQSLGASANVRLAF